MRRVLDVNILEDESVQRQVVLWSLPAMAVGIVVLGWHVAASLARTGSPDWGWLVAVAAVYLASLPAHELIHGLFFKLLGPKGTHVRFGFKQGMLYATCPGTLFGRSAFLAVLLAPFTLLSLAYAAGALVSGAWGACLAVAMLHASGCSGDLYFAWLIATRPDADLCEDTAVGITLWDRDA